MCDCKSEERNFENEEILVIPDDDDLGYCQRCGGKFNNKVICEVCGDTEEWAWHTPRNKNKIECANCGNEIYEVRRYCFSCGAKNELAFKKGDKYCPKCGNAFENGICPNCGKEKNDVLLRTIKPEDLRYCAVCGEKTSADDYFCFYCGNENYINEPVEHRPDISQEEKPEEIIIPRRIHPDDYHCPECGGYFDMEGFCWNCAVDRVKVSVRKLKVKDARYCPFCREIISVKDDFCTYCGEKVHRKGPEPESVKKPEPEQEKPAAKIPEQLKTTQPAGYDGYYFADLHTTLWLVLGIVSLVICCLPTGIGTIICSLGAKRAENELEYDIAKRKTIFAKIWFFAGCAIVAALMIASVIIQVTTN